MREALKNFNSIKKYPFHVSFGIGLHSGLLVAGNIGTPSRLEYTFIGDTVNAAARIESKTKDFSCDILASQQILASLNDKSISSKFVSVGEVHLKGKESALTVFRAN